MGPEQKLIIYYKISEDRGTEALAVKESSEASEFSHQTTLCWYNVKLNFSEKVKIASYSIFRELEPVISQTPDKTNQRPVSRLRDHLSQSEARLQSRQPQLPPAPASLSEAPIFAH